MGALAAVIGLGGLFAASSYKQYAEQKKASKAQQQAREAEQSRAELQNQQQKLAQVRAARLEQAKTQQRSINLGVQESTGASGTASSIGSQVSGNLNYLNQDIGFVRAGNTAMNSYYNHSLNASLCGSVAQLSQMGTSAAYGSYNSQQAAQQADTAYGQQSFNATGNL